MIVMAKRWSGLTVLTAVVVALFLSSVVNLLWTFSLPSVIVFALGALFTFWIVGGCARQGEPLRGGCCVGRARAPAAVLTLRSRCVDVAKRTPDRALCSGGGIH